LFISLPLFMLPFIPAFILPFMLPVVLLLVLLELFQLAPFIPVVPFNDPLVFALSFMLPFVFPEAFIVAEPEVPVVPVELLALNEPLLVPEVPLLVELELPALLESVVEGLAALFIPVVPFKEESVAMLEPIEEVPTRLEAVVPLAKTSEESPVPVVTEPDVLALPDTDPPVVTEPETPPVAEPEVPAVAESDMLAEPFTPALVVPFIEVLLPFTEPFAVAFMPVPVVPETLPDVAAVPFKEELLDPLAFTPEADVPLFQLLKFMLVLEPGIAVNTQSPVKSSLKTPCLEELFPLSPVE